MHNSLLKSLFDNEIVQYRSNRAILLILGSVFNIMYQFICIISFLLRKQFSRKNYFKEVKWFIYKFICKYF